MRPELTAERLREVLHYDRETGVFTRRIANSSLGRVGEVVGCHNGKYLVTQVDGRQYYLHRLAFLYEHGAWPSQQIDHINGDRLDNRISNLRDVDGATNSQNMKGARSHNTTGYLGATPHKKSGLYQARIVVRGKKVALGYYRTPEEAHQAYLAAKRKLHEGCTI